MKSKLSVTRFVAAYQKASQFLFILLIGAFFVLPKYSYSANYYFSSSIGNDQNSIIQAQNQHTPWKTLSKLNSFFLSMAPGDSILFKRGDIFDGFIVLTHSSISFGAYGSGSKPVISGLIPLTSWKSVGGGIYEALCNTDGTSLIINGSQQGMGRYPNTGYLSYESHSGNSSITDNQLSASINWTGAEVVIRKNRWTIDRRLVTQHSGNTLNYEAGSKDAPTNGYGYFIQNSEKTLDQFGEWYFDASRKTMMVFFGSKDPSSYHVKTSSGTNLVDIRRSNNVSFDNIEFLGASINAFNIVNSKGVTIKNCVTNITGTDAFSVSYSPDFKLENSVINHSLNSGMHIDDGCTNAIIKNNTIKNTGLIVGLGKSVSGTNIAITSFGANAKIEKNNIDSTGYNGIYFGGNSASVKNNFINNFCLTKDDGAGIYVGDWFKSSNKEIIGNIVLNGIGNSQGTNASYLAAEGIYIDDLSESVTVAGNTVSMCSNNGIKIHDAQYVNIYNNTVYNNGVQLRLEQDHYSSTSTNIRNIDIKSNIFFSKIGTQLTSKLSTQQDDIASFGSLDSNFYFRPVNELANITAYIVKNGTNVNKSYDLAGWKAAYNKDQHSVKTQQSIPANSIDNYILFQYNATSTVKTIALSKSYIDVHNKIYTNKISINPYSSVLLIASDQKAVATSTIKASQTITFSQAESTTIASAPVEVVSVASSGLPVELKIASGPAEIDGKTVKFKGYGTVVIEATQSGNEQYQPAKATTKILNVASGVANSSAIISNKETKAELKAYPNPFNNKLILELILPVSGNSALSLYDLQGKLIVNIYSGFIKANEPQKYSVDAGSIKLVRGMYLVKVVSAANAQLYQKVVHII